MFSWYSGHIQVLDWACRNGCESIRKIVENAAQYGHVEVIEWAR
jgi:hypothetical protein